MLLFLCSILLILKYINNIVYFREILNSPKQFLIQVSLKYTKQFLSIVYILAYAIISKILN